MQQIFKKEFWKLRSDSEFSIKERSASRIQAWVRGRRQRKRFESSRELVALVSGSVMLSSEGNKQSVPAYVITSIRGGCCWQVYHRYSDWLELTRRLSPLCGGAAMPELPSRFPFRSSAVVSRREFSLNRFLQQMLRHVADVPRARAMLLEFLSCSHQHWLYDKHAAMPPPLFTSAVRDTSSGLSHIDRSAAAAAAADASARAAASNIFSSPTGMPWQQGVNGTRPHSNSALPPLPPRLTERGRLDSAASF